LVVQELQPLHHQKESPMKKPPKSKPKRHPRRPRVHPAAASRDPGPRPRPPATGPGGPDRRHPPGSRGDGPPAHRGRGGVPGRGALEPQGGLPSAPRRVHRDDDLPRRRAASAAQTPGPDLLTCPRLGQAPLCEGMSGGPDSAASRPTPVTADSRTLWRAERVVDASPRWRAREAGSGCTRNPRLAAETCQPPRQQFEPSGLGARVGRTLVGSPAIHSYAADP
jgi:hypothetical protein